MNKRKILFVDDDSGVLSGLKRMLHKMKDEWDMKFVSGGQEALDCLARETYDVIISDMKMPKMTGAQLLKKVSEKYPNTIRFILSGHSDKELILQSVGYAHRYLAKPCDPDKLRQLLATSLGIREMLTSRELHARISKIKSLPSPPEIYNKVISEVQSPNANLNRIADLISQDVGMTAKVLQMVNSAFFSLPTHVDNLRRAVSLLGLNTIQGLLLTAGIFSCFENTEIMGISVNIIYTHSMSVGANAHAIAKQLGMSQNSVEDAQMAGMLHDIGKLILMEYFREETKQVIKLAVENKMPLYFAEKEILGVSHAKIGAHLLSLWGLPDSIIEAIIFHHSPSKAGDISINVLTAVHIANALTPEFHETGRLLKSSTIDPDYIQALGLSNRLESFNDICNSNLEIEKV